MGSKSNGVRLTPLLPLLLGAASYADRFPSQLVAHSPQPRAVKVSLAQDALAALAHTAGHEIDADVALVALGAEVCLAEHAHSGHARNLPEDLTPPHSAMAYDRALVDRVAAAFHAA